MITFSRQFNLKRHSSETSNKIVSHFSYGEKNMFETNANVHVKIIFLTLLIFKYYKIFFLTYV